MVCRVKIKSYGARPFLYLRIIEERKISSKGEREGQIRGETLP